MAAGLTFEQWAEYESASSSERPCIERAFRLVEEARSALVRAAEAAEASAPEELILSDLQGARGAFEEVTGKRTADDVLHRIFAQFCIGK